MSTGQSGSGSPFKPKNRIRLIFNRKIHFDSDPKQPSVTAPSNGSSMGCGYYRTIPSPSPVEEQEPPTYRSSFRLYIVPKSPKKQKRSRSPSSSTWKPSVKSGLAIELWLFLRAYTGLKEYAVFNILESIFKDLDWEECAEMDEAQAAIELNLYDAEDNDDESERGSLKRMFTRILELAEKRITTAFEELVVRMRGEGYGDDGILIPPRIKAEEEEEKNAIPGLNLLQSTLSWCISSDHGMILEPVMRQIVPEPTQRHPYDIDPDDPAILKERQEYYDHHLKEAAQQELEHQQICQIRAIERHIAAIEDHQKECKRRYWELVALQDALTVERDRELPNDRYDAAGEESDNFSLDDMMSVISTEKNWSTSSDEVKASEMIRRRNNKSPHHNLARKPENTLRWAMEVGQSSLDDADNATGAYNRKMSPNSIPGLMPFPPAPILRIGSPKRKASEAGLDERHVMFDLNQGWEGQPSNAEEEQRMLEQAIRESMADTHPGQNQSISPAKAQSPSGGQLPIQAQNDADEGRQSDTEMSGMGQQESGVFGLSIIAGEANETSVPEKDDSALQQLAQYASTQLDDLTTGMDSLATLTPPIPMEIFPVSFVRQEEEIDELLQLETDVIKNAEIVKEQKRRLMELTTRYMRQPTLKRTTASLGSGLLKAVNDADEVAKHFSKALREGQIGNTTGKKEADELNDADNESEAPVSKMPIAKMTTAQIPIDKMPIDQMPNARMSIAKMTTAQMPIDQMPNAGMPIAKMLSDMEERKNRRQRAKIARDRVILQWKVLQENKAKWRKEDEEYLGLEQRCRDEKEAREKEVEEARRMQMNAEEESGDNVQHEEKVKTDEEEKSTATRLSQALEAEHKSFTESNDDKKAKEENEKEDDIMEIQFDDEADIYEEEEESDENDKQKREVESIGEGRSLVRRLGRALEPEHDDYTDYDEDEAELTQTEIQAIIDDSTNAVAETEDAANTEKEARKTEPAQIEVTQELMETEQTQTGMPQIGGLIPTEINSIIGTSTVTQNEIEEAAERGMEGIEMIRMLESLGEPTQAEIEEIRRQSKHLMEVVEIAGKAETVVEIMGTAEVVVETAQAVLETAPVGAASVEMEVGKESGKVTVNIEEVGSDEEMGGV